MDPVRTDADGASRDLHRAGLFSPSFWKTIENQKKQRKNFSISKSLCNFARHYKKLRRLPPPITQLIVKTYIYKMKKDLHPSNYREVAFKDMSNDEVFIIRSTVNSKETIDIDGTTYPLVKLEITSSSHPFFTGKQKLVDTAGRVDKFKRAMATARRNNDS